MLLYCSINPDKKTVVITESQARFLKERTETIPGFPDSECQIPPTVTMKGYKLVRLAPNPKLLKDKLGWSPKLSKEQKTEIEAQIQDITKQVTGKVFPPYFLGNGWELGKWYTAGMQDIQVEIDDTTGHVTSIHATGRNPKGGKMDLSPNVGLHALSAPRAYDNAQGDKANGKGYMPPDLVWAEVEINFEEHDKNDYDSRIGSIGSKGVTRDSMYKELQQMSKDGKPFYRGGHVKGFNGKGKTERVTVYLSSDFRFTRLLTQEEVKQICTEKGVQAIDHELAVDVNYYFPNNSWKG